MKTFSPSDAAFEGFRIIRNNPGVLLAWALAYFLLSAAILALFVVLVGPQWSDFAQAIDAIRHGNGERAVELMSSFQGVSQLVNLIQAVVLVVFTCAVYRASLRPEEGGFGYLRIGMDEVRVGVLRFAYFVGWFIAAFLLVIVFAIVFGIAIAAAVGGQAGAHAPQMMGSWIIFAALAFCLLLIWPAVRLSLSEVITFNERRFAFFDSWGLTRGQFWRILGAYVLAWLMGLILMIIGLVIVAVVGLTTLAGVWPRLMAGDPDWATLAPAFAPVAIAYLLVGTFLGAIYRTILTAPAAYIYRALCAGGACDLADAHLPPITPNVLVL